MTRSLGLRLLPGSPTASHVLPRLPVAPFVACVVVVTLAAANGGYFPPSWAWAGLFFAWLALVTVMTGRASVPARLDLTFVAGVAALGVLELVSSAWGSEAVAVREVERTLAYLAAVAALVLVLRRATVPRALGGALAGAVAVCLYALATRLFPDRLGTFDSVAGYRLAEPLGYWNALGIFAAMATLTALGFAAHARHSATAALSGAAIVPLVLTVYFTFSRGASIALGIGLVAAIAASTRRLRLASHVLLLALPAAAIVALASRSRALTYADADVAAAAHAGHRLALAVVALAVVAGAAVAVTRTLERRITFPFALRRAYGGALLALAIGALLAGLVTVGGPVRTPGRVWSAFSAPPPNGGANLNRHLFNLSGSARPQLWRQTLDASQDRLLAGSGAGTFERWWLSARHEPDKVRDAHSLYVETLFELGAPGLALVVVILAVPFAALRRARQEPLAAAVFGGYTAFVVHAGADWDWEMPIVTIAGLALGVALLAYRRSDEHRRPRGAARRTWIAALAAFAGLLVLQLAGTIAQAQSSDAARAGGWAKSESQARRAATWAPWSPEPWRLVGEAQLARGELGPAQASFRKAIGKDGGDWSLWLDLARASEGRAQLAALDRASRLNPLSPEIAQFRTELDELGTIQVEAEG